MFINCTQKGFGRSISIRADRIVSLLTVEYNGQSYTQIDTDDNRQYVVNEYTSDIELKIKEALE